MPSRQQKSAKKDSQKCLISRTKSHFSNFENRRSRDQENVRQWRQSFLGENFS